MDAQLGNKADALTFLAALAQEPFKYDFYQTLRRIECLYPERPRWGTGKRPSDDPVRLGQSPELTFAPAPLHSLEAGTQGAPSRLNVRLFGLSGPNGPLPIHLTEYARERLRLGDPTFARFLDLFNHRFLALFYRAWAQAQPHVNRDRPRDDRFSIYVGSLIGVGPAPMRERDRVPDLAKFFHVGVLVRHVRGAEGLRAILASYFRVPVRIEEFVGHWMYLGRGERTYLRRDGAALGAGAVLGSQVWDRQHKFRIHLGPLTLAQYEAFLPAWRQRGGEGLDGRLLPQLVDWVRFHQCFELEWDVRLTLAAAEVPQLRLGSRSLLGWTTWLGRRTNASDADDLCLDAETFLERDRVA